MIAVGIDPGVETGFAGWDLEATKLLFCESLKIHQAMDRVREMHLCLSVRIVIVEDARQRGWFGKSDRERLQGAGSIKRDCLIWEDFLREHRVPFVMNAPLVRGTKLDAQVFRQFSGWTQRTNEHARDAGMLVCQLTNASVTTMMLRASPAATAM